MKYILIALVLMSSSVQAKEIPTPTNKYEFCEVMTRDYPIVTKLRDGHFTYDRTLSLYLQAVKKNAIKTKLSEFQKGFALAWAATIVDEIYEKPYRTGKELRLLSFADCMKKNPEDYGLQLTF